MNVGPCYYSIGLPVIVVGMFSSSSNISFSFDMPLGLINCIEACHYNLCLGFGCVLYLLDRLHSSSLPFVLSSKVRQV